MTRKRDYLPTPVRAIRRRRLVIVTVVGIVLSLLTSNVAVGGADPNTSIFQKLFPAAPPATSVEHPTPAAGTRILRFPADRTLGNISIRDAAKTRVIESYYHWTELSVEWKYLCPAAGEVTIEPGKIVQLTVARDGWRDLSALAEIDPDSFYGLTVHGSYQGGPKPTDGITADIAHLTGLRSLGFAQAIITAAGVERLLALRDLEYLTLPESADDQVMALLPSFSKLKGLYLGENRLTNVGLAYLKDVPALEELALGPGRMTDKGLMQLAACRNLQYLSLAGTNFTDFGMTYIKDIPRLKTLHASALNHLTDRGMENISTAAQVERMDFHWADGITETGLGHLSKLSGLKMLEVRHAKLTDGGTAILARMKGLECLDIDGQNITDAGLTRLAGLTCLRKLDVSRAFYVDPNTDKNYYTDAGIARITANCTQLEELHVGSIGMTDASMKAIAGLKNLRRLSLFGVPNVTDAGFAQLRSLESLEDLWFVGRKVTLAAIPSLKDLPNLKQIKVTGIPRGGVLLDMSGFARLEKLSLSLAHRPADTFGDADLAGLAQCRTLQWLQIGPRSYSDEGMKHLRNLTEMERLGIGGPMLTDEGLAHLTRMKKLNHLSILDGQFTEKAHTYLEQLPALSNLFVPQCEAFDARGQQRLKSRLPNLVTVQIQPRR